jgi:hypothetical protein
MTERKVLVYGLGARVGRGDKVPAIEGLARASNESRHVFESWYAARRGDRLPRLSDVFPGTLGPLLASILVVDVLPRRHDYRYRFVGETEAAARVDDPTGRTVREVDGDAPEVLAFCLENYDLAVASPTGILDFSLEASVNPKFLEIETLLLPLSEDGRRVTQVIVYSHYVRS